MVTQELIAFIREKLRKGESKESVTKTLLEKKWKIDDINQALKTATAIVSPLPKIRKEINIKKIAPKVFLTIVILTIVGITVFFIVFTKNSSPANNLKTNQIHVPKDYKVVELNKEYVLENKNKVAVTVLEDSNTNAQITITQKNWDGKDLNCLLEEKVIGSIKYCLGDYLKESEATQKRTIQWIANNFAFEITASDSRVTFDELIIIAEQFTKAPPSAKYQEVQNLSIKIKIFFRLIGNYLSMALQSVKKYQGF